MGHDLYELPLFFAALRDNLSSVPLRQLPLRVLRVAKTFVRLYGVPVVAQCCGQAVPHAFERNLWLVMSSSVTLL